MKAVWLNSINEVFDIIDEADGVSVIAKMPYVWNVIAEGDTIKFVDDDDENYIVGGVYDKMNRRLA